MTGMANETKGTSGARALLFGDADDSNEVVLSGGFVLFWGGYPSNWYPAMFTVVDGDGIPMQYNCVEQYMMVEKARMFNDQSTLKKIMRARTPKAQKELGRAVGTLGFDFPLVANEHMAERKVRRYDDAQWSAGRYAVVLKGTIEKYRQNHELLRRLLATGDAPFVECSPYDDIWGIGMSALDAGATDPKKWRGQNLLGKAITEARDILRRGG